MLAQRILTAVIGIPILLTSLYYGGLVWRLLILVIVGLGLVEFARMHGKHVYPDYLVVSGLSFFAITYSGLDDRKLLLWLVAQFLYYLIRATFSGMRNFRASFNLLGLLYVVVLYSFLVLVREEFGVIWTFFGLAITWLTDTGAYFGGIRSESIDSLLPSAPKVRRRGAVRPIGRRHHRCHFRGCVRVHAAVCPVCPDSVRQCSTR